MTGDSDPLRQATEKAQSVLATHRAELLRKANVTGVGVGFCQRAGRPTQQVGIIVMVRRKLPPAALAPEDLLPDELDGVPVDVQEVGELRAL